MAYPAGFETRSDSAVGGTINDVTTGTGASTDLITASNHNILQSAIYELEKKLGLATIAKADTAGHFAMPHTTDGGPPTGNPDNGEGSMVWDSANNKLYVATADSATWAEIGGGGGSAFTDPVTIYVDNSSAALSVRQDGAGKTFDFRMEAAGAYSEISYFSSEAPKAGSATTTTHFDSGPSNYPNEFKIYPSYMAGGGTAFEVLAKSSNSLFQVGTTNTVGTVGFGANATVTSSVPADKWRWSYGFTLSDISGAGVTFINQTYTSIGRSTAIHLDSRGAGEGDLVILDASDNQLALFNYTGQVILGTPALATGATIGFPYMPAMAGTPSGTPTAKTGSCAFHYDTSNDKLYVYNGGWQSVTLS